MVLPTTPISSIEEALFRRNKKVLRGILSYFSSTKGFSREKKEHSIHLQNRVSSRGHLSLFIRGDLCVSFSLHVSSSEQKKVGKKQEHLSALCFCQARLKFGKVGF